MSQILKYLGDSLRRTFGTVVERPMPWKVIDKLASLEEKCEQSEEFTEGDGRTAQKSERVADGSVPKRRSHDSSA